MAAVPHRAVIVRVTTWRWPRRAGATCHVHADHSCRESVAILARRDGRAQRHDLMTEILATRFGRLRSSLAAMGGRHNDGTVSQIDDIGVVILAHRDGRAPPGSVPTRCGVDKVLRSSLAAMGGR